MVGDVPQWGKPVSRLGVQKGSGGRLRKEGITHMSHNTLGNYIH
jgi:hypothetical protein